MRPWLVQGRTLHRAGVGVGACSMRRRTVSATRRGVPRSVQPQAGAVMTRSLEGNCCTTEREKSTLGRRSYSSASAAESASRTACASAVAISSTAVPSCSRSRASSAVPVAPKMKLFQSAFFSNSSSANGAAGFSTNRATVREPSERVRPGTMYPSSGSGSSGAIPMRLIPSGL